MRWLTAFRGTPTLAFAASAWIAQPASAVSIDWVTVGNPGNPCEYQPAGAPGSGSPLEGCFGSTWSYRIAKFETTNSDYAEFLNARAAVDDPLGLYNPSMALGTGGIVRSGSQGSFTYTAIPGREAMPVVYVSLFDGMRFANWLHNGQGSGETEDGAYTLLGGTPTPSNWLGAYRNLGAIAFVTSEDEWYKAAYYDPLSASYFDYPTASNAPTVCAAPGVAANRANCNSVNGGLTAVGSYSSSQSPYGTFDQGGNVSEWNEAAGYSYRGMRGGGYQSGTSILRAAERGYAVPWTETGSLGFRVASIPEPGTGLLLMAGLASLATLRRRFE